MEKWDKFKFGASGTYAWYVVWHWFWSGALGSNFTFPDHLAQ